MANCLFDTYKNYVMTHVKHVFQTSSDTTITPMYAYPSSNYTLPHWKGVLCFRAQCPRIDIPSKEL